MPNYAEGIKRGIEQTKSRAVRGTMEIESQPFCQVDLAEAIARVNDLLRRDYGCDYAYTIAANGKTIAASNYSMGVVIPRFKR